MVYFGRYSSWELRTPENAPEAMWKCLNKIQKFSRDIPSDLPRCHVLTHIIFTLCPPYSYETLFCPPWVIFYWCDMAWYELYSRYNYIHSWLATYLLFAASISQQKIDQSALTGSEQQPEKCYKITTPNQKPPCQASLLQPQSTSSSQQ